MTRNTIRAALGGSLLALTALLATPALSQATMTDAEVRKVDKESKKITLKHGEIRNLDMPPMTMVFGVSDAALLGKVKAGDKIRFRASKKGDNLIVTEIQPAR